MQLLSSHRFHDFCERQLLTLLKFQLQQLPSSKQGFCLKLAIQSGTVRISHLFLMLLGTRTAVQSLGLEEATTPLPVHVCVRAALRLHLKGN